MRAAVGQAGKAPGAFDKFQTFTARSVLSGHARRSPGQSWQRRPCVRRRPPSSEAGFESGFFHDRLGVEASIYRSQYEGRDRAEAASAQRRIPDGGTSTSERSDNNGWEASINYLAVATASPSWTTNVRLDGKQEQGHRPRRRDTYRDGTIQVGYPVQWLSARCR